MFLEHTALRYTCTHTLSVKTIFVFSQARTCIRHASCNGGKGGGVKVTKWQPGGHFPFLCLPNQNSAASRSDSPSRFLFFPPRLSLHPSPSPHDAFTFLSVVLSALTHLPLRPPPRLAQRGAPTWGTQRCTSSPRAPSQPGAAGHAL